jgi:hypothetical protein
MAKVPITGNTESENAPNQGKTASKLANIVLALTEVRVTKSVELNQSLNCSARP